MQQRRQPVTLTDVKSTGARNSPEVLENLAYYYRSPCKARGISYCQTLSHKNFQVSGMSVKKDFSQEIVYFNNLLQTYKRNREPANSIRQIPEGFLN